MELMELIVQLLTGVAWPVTVLVIALVFRRDLAQAAAKLTRLRWRDLEAEFGEKLRELKAETVPPALPAPPDKQEDYGDEYLKEMNRRKDRVAAIALGSPRSAILEAWILLEKALFDAAQRLNVSISGGALHIAQELADQERIPRSYPKHVEWLSQLRNAAVHDPAFEISSTQIGDYLDAALDLTASIDTFTDARLQGGFREDSKYRVDRQAANKPLHPTLGSGAPRRPSAG